MNFMRGLSVKSTVCLAFYWRTCIDNFLVLVNRFGSLDRRRGGNNTVEGRDLEPRQDSPIHRLYNPAHAPSPTMASVLLPSQTYPENSLMRTQSLGTVDHSVSRKSREKEWYETSLDTGPQSSSSTIVPPPTPPPPPPPLPPSLSPQHSSSYVEGESASHVTNSVPTTTAQQLSFDTVSLYYIVCARVCDFI